MINDIKINIQDLKNIVSKLNLAIEKTKINPKAGWIELELLDNKKLSFKVANYDYYLEILINSECVNDSSDTFHVTISADTFIPLVSKLDDDFVYISEKYNVITFSTCSNEYTFPTIKEFGKVKTIDSILYNVSNENSFTLSGTEVSSIADSNAKGLIDSIVSKDIQQFIYVDCNGAITFTENVYLNTFKSRPVQNNLTNYTKFLINCTQAKLLKVFDQFEEVNVRVELFSEASSKKVKLTSSDSICSVSLILVVQSDDLTETFPEIRLRSIANKISSTHIVLDKRKLDKALSRLMVFDKKWSSTVLDYSKICFYDDHIKLVSIKNKNFEKIEYTSSSNAIKHESIIRFADLVTQLKAIKSKEIDISYGEYAISINSGNLVQLIPEIRLYED